MSIHKVPSDNVLNLYEMRIRGSNQLETFLSEQDVEQQDSYLSNQKMKDMVKRCFLSEDQSPSLGGTEMKESRQKHKRKTEGNHSALQGNRKIVISGKVC